MLLRCVKGFEIFYYGLVCGVYHATKAVQAVVVTCCGW